MIDQIDESALETIEISIPDRPTVAFNFNYEPLPISIDLCIAAVEAAIAQMGHPHVSSDLYVSPELAHDGFAQQVLDGVPANLYVNRLRVNPMLAKHEWFIESGEGRRVGCRPPE